MFGSKNIFHGYSQSYDHQIQLVDSQVTSLIKLSSQTLNDLRPFLKRRDIYFFTLSLSINKSELLLK